MRSFSRSFLILSGEVKRLASLASLSNSFFSPVAASTDQSSPCSPASSRCTKEKSVLSGLHSRVSGPRPVMPPAAKMASIVNGFFAGAEVWVKARAANSKTAVRKIGFFTRKLPGANCHGCGIKSVHRWGECLQVESELSGLQREIFRCDAWQLVEPDTLCMPGRDGAQRPENFRADLGWLVALQKFVYTLAGTG